MPHKFLVHHKGDHVGVAVADIHPGETVTGIYMDSGERCLVASRSEIPLGHKIALQDMEPVGFPVLKYGVRIGLSTAPIRAGEWVHTHNIKTARW